MNLILVSDLHLGPHTEARNQGFLELLHNAKKADDEVLILGDLFDLWFGFDGLTYPYQRPIIAEMKKLAEAGLAMDYVEGNRDFHIRTYEGSIFRSVSESGLERKWGSRQLYAEHGDLVNVDDRQYRMFRRISKNRLSYFLMKRLPSRFFLSSADGMEKKMKSTNIKYKMEYPEQHCRTFVKKKGEEGADIVVLGHFHEQKEWAITVPHRDVLFYNLPGWESGIRYLVVPGDSSRPYFAEQG